MFPCAIEILSFQNFYEVLKTCSAGRKDFFDTLNGPFGAVLKSAYASVWVGSISVGLGMGCSL